jgi:Tfp pilus assembly protein PilN
MSLNLASQPFVNSRPVRRLVLVLWCLSVLLVAANVFFYARHFSGQQERRDRLAALIELEGQERDRLAELDRELTGFDLDWQNRQISFLNLRIAERVFPWSRLFDRLAKALPRDVRLTRLKPEIRGLSGAAGGPEETVQLEIRAEARTEEAMLGLLGRLFKHRAFRDPNLSSENRPAKSNVTDFALTVTYLPTPAAAAPGTAAGAAGGAEEGEQ